MLEAQVRWIFARGMKATLIARVAVDVRFYFDVAVSSRDKEQIRPAARRELDRVAADERFQTTLLRHPNLYPADDWPALAPDNFRVCDLSPADQISREKRLPL